MQFHQLVSERYPFLAWLWSLVMLQPNGPDNEGVLLTNGYANIFEVPDPEDPKDLWAVIARWSGDGWGFGALPIGGPIAWVAGDRVFGCSVADSSAL